MDASEARDFDESRLYLMDPLTVTLTRPASYSGGSEASLTVQYVQGQPADESAVEHPMGGGALEGTRRAFRMWLIECLGMPPHRGFFIGKQDGTLWHVDKVDVLCHGRQFRCSTTKRPT